MKSQGSTAVIGELHQLNGHPETSLESADNNNQKCRSWKTPALLIFVMILIIAIIVLAILYAQSTYPPSGDPACCPYGWIGYQQRCYFFSKEEMNWTASEDFCTLREASLARIESNKTSEKDFVMLNKGKYPYWIGLSRDPGHPWKWTNGDISALTVYGGEHAGDCAYLNEEAVGSSSRCSNTHRFICSKSVASQKPKGT